MSTLTSILSEGIPSINDEVNIVSRIIIPKIQRDYAQGKDKPKANEVRKKFLASLHTALTGEQTIHLDYVYGNISNGKFSVLDGQQRLTTLFLLHWYHANKEAAGEDHPFKKTFINNGYSRFTYEVRPSSIEFFDQLSLKVGSIELNKPEKLSSLIRNESWFFPQWEYDITVDSCLRMLDDIHEKFKDDDINYEDVADRFTFETLPLEDFGLSDDLYLKMNARGKPLTTFESVKALIIKDLRENYTDRFFQNSPWPEYFTAYIDNKWAEFLWEFRDRQTHTYDSEIMRFLYAIAVVSLENNARKNNNEEGLEPTHSRFDKLLAHENEVQSFTNLDEAGAIHKRFYENLLHTMSYISERAHNNNSRISRIDYEKDLFYAKGDNRESPNEKYLKLSALTAYLGQHEVLDNDTFHAAVDEFMEFSDRCIRNTNLRRDTTNPDGRGLYGTIRGLVKCANDRENINRNDFGHFSAHLEDERTRAALLEAEPNRGWQQAFCEAEESLDLNRQLLGLFHILEITTETRNFDLEEFSTMSTKLGSVIKLTKDAHGNGNALLHRAMASLCGSHIFETATNGYLALTSQTANDANDNWKAKLRNPANTGFLSALRRFLAAMGGVTPEDAEVTAEELINDDNTEEAWLKSFIETGLSHDGYGHPKLLGERNGIYRFTRNKQWNGQQGEIFTYSLAKKFGLENSYEFVNGIQRVPYLKISDNLAVVAQGTDGTLEIHVLAERGEDSPLGNIVPVDQLEHEDYPAGFVEALGSPHA